MQNRRHPWVGRVVIWPKCREDNPLNLWAAFTNKDVAPIDYSAWSPGPKDRANIAASATGKASEGESVINIPVWPH